MFNKIFNFFKYIIQKMELYGDWGLGIGDWGVGNRDWGLGNGDNSESTIPHTKSATPTSNTKI